MSSRPASAQFPALGTTAVIVAGDAEALPSVRAAVQETVDAFDRACSRFREDSELSALNLAAGSVVRVSPLLGEALEAALRAARITDGDVDPTIGEALIALGYDRDFASLAPAREIQFASVPGWQTVRLDPGEQTVRVPRGVKLDLGATAKALAADHAAAAACRAAGCGVLVSLGGDIATAGEAPEGGWNVRVTDDHAAGEDAPGQRITLRTGGLATSSTTVRRWRGPEASELVHHLVDPATGRSVQGAWRTASVCAASCLDANIASTAAIIRGERAVAWLRSLGLPSRLVGIDGTALHIAGWPEDGEELPPARAAAGARA